jgi:hypothetical protein
MRDQWFVSDSPYNPPMLKIMTPTSAYTSKLSKILQDTQILNTLPKFKSQKEGKLW